jgi:hypothetical protein
LESSYTPEKAQALFEGLPERFEASGVVRSFALAAQAPFATEDEDADVPLTAEDSLGASRVQKSALEETVGAGYFAMLSEPMLAGREFTERDQGSDPDGSKTLPAVLNESAARGLFGNEDVLGRTFEITSNRMK